ncbi:Tll0287-like domain-containing protein [Coleofasciculus sp. E1-EBD-02]|jgi:hypothetical protein|uniref:Tll0287-like domain-containing protein n=1 Tax=unclassified Coleofasciculus TaxID=2692782 RepID=UPI0032FFC878
MIWKSLSKIVLGILIGMMVLSGYPLAANAQTDPAELAKAVQEVEYLDAMRSGLASTLEGQTEEPTLQTMQQVCKPVGMKAKKLSQDNGWLVKQIATKYRNPAHAPDNLQSKMALAQLEKNPQLIGFWQRETLNGVSGTRYYRRINVEASCLACHGAKDSRPEFVQQNYPQDRAFDFNVGDLRGMYAVFLPDVQQGLQEALTP